MRQGGHGLVAAGNPGVNSKAPFTKQRRQFAMVQIAGNAWLGDPAAAAGLAKAGAEALAAGCWTVVVSGRRNDALTPWWRDRQKRRQGRGDSAGCQQVRRRDQGRRRRFLAGMAASIPCQQAPASCAERSWADMERKAETSSRYQSQRRCCTACAAVLPAMRRQKDGCIINVASWAGRHVSKMPGPAYHDDQACGAGADAFVQHGRMRQRPARLLSLARRGRDPDPETAAGGAVGTGAGADAAARGLRPHHRLRRLHAAAGSASTRS